MSAAVVSEMTSPLPRVVNSRASGDRWLRHLLWKDLRLLRPLIWAALIAPLAIALLVGFSWLLVGNRQSEFAGGLILFSLLPWLVALGSPPMVVGTENDERTFDWLRRLPISWWRVLVSKVIASVLAVLLSFVWTGVLGLFCNAVFDLGWLKQSGDALPLWQGIVIATYLLYGSLLVLTLSFFTSYLIRNSLAAAILVIPLLIGWVYVSTNLYDWYGVKTPLMPWSRFYFGPLLFHAGIMVATVGLARYRLVGPSDQSWWFSTWLTRLFPSRREPRPVVLPLASTLRPAIGRALIWQHVTQNRLLFLLVVFIAVSSPWLGGLLGMPWRFAIFLMVYPVNMLLQLTLGVSVFHGDNRMPRRYFFADRGLPARLIWWTRMLVPSLLSLAIIFATVLTIRLWGAELRTQNDMSLVLPPIYILLFLIGVSTGQWVRRGALAFFMAPAIAYFAAILIAFAAVPAQASMSSHEITLIGWIAFASLLASTVHLNQLSLRGRDGAALAIPAIGWLALPIVLTAIGSGISRIAMLVAG